MWEVLDALLEPFYGPALYALGWPAVKVLTLGRYPGRGCPAPTAWRRSGCVERE